MESSQLSRLQALNSGIRKDEMYSDMTVTCHGSTFKLHKNIVCTQSKPLAAAFSGKFLESENSTIDLDDDDPEVVEFMVRYLYEQKMDLADKENDKLLLLVVKIYIIADKYDIAPLTHLARAKFSEVLPTAYKTPSFIPSLHLIYHETAPNDRSLKDPAIMTITTHIDELLEQPAFTELCEGHAALSLEVLKASRAQPEEPHTLRLRHRERMAGSSQRRRCACGRDMTYIDAKFKCCVHCALAGHPYDGVSGLPAYYGPPRDFR